ncbi:MAG: hypothetical protein ACK40X_11705, partial [Armatimonadota bacterium]
MSAELLAIIDKLEKPMAVEEKTGCRNFAVIGGFDKYMVAWAKRAGEFCDGDELRQFFAEIERLFEGYTDVDVTERRRRILQARNLLTQVRQRLNQKTHAAKPVQPPPAKTQTVPEVPQSSEPTSYAHLPSTAQTNQPLGSPATKLTEEIRPYDETTLAEVAQLRRRKNQTISPTARLQPSASSPLSLSDPVRYLKGVGPQRAKLLKRLGVETVGGLLHFYPRRYEDRRNLKTLAEVVPGEKVVVQVQVIGNPFTEERKHLLITKVPVGDATGRAFLVWFNQPYMEKKFRLGQRFFVFGKATQVFGQLTFQTPEIEEVSGDANLQVGRLVPVYPLTEG